VEYDADDNSSDSISVLRDVNVSNDGMIYGPKGVVEVGKAGDLGWHEV
jgi:hypothetical protein